MARRPKQIFPCFAGGSLLQILGSNCLVWTFRASDTAVPHRGSQAETPSRSAVCVQSTSSQHESSVEGMEVLSTLLAGLSDTGLSADSAQALRSWHAFKVCSVLNTPVHLTRISTSDLFRLHQIQDPVQLVLARMHKRLRKLLRRADTHPDVTTSAQVIPSLLLSWDLVTGFQGCSSWGPPSIEASTLAKNAADLSFLACLTACL